MEQHLDTKHPARRSAKTLRSAATNFTGRGDASNKPYEAISDVSVAMNVLGSSEIGLAKIELEGVARVLKRAQETIDSVIDFVQNEPIEHLQAPEQSRIWGNA